MRSAEERHWDFIDVLKSWFSWRSEPANISRSFWMPDDSCVVCYECDSQFNVINRRHHCRKCGRVFCARCTSNSIPAESNDLDHFREDGERIRVCNFCFSQWKESIEGDNNNALELLSLDGSSLSVASLNSPKLNSTPNKKVISSSFPNIHGVSENLHYGSAPSLGQYVQLQVLPERKCDAKVATYIGHQMVEVQDGSSTHYSFCSNRSDDDYDEYGGLHSDSETQRLSGHDGCYSQHDFEIEQHGGSNSFHSATVSDHMDRDSSIHDKAQQNAALGLDKTDGSPVDISDDCNVSSNIWDVDNTHLGPMDFENTRELWQPPDPENEEDERESSFLDEDDEGEDEDAASEWRDASSPSTFMSSKYKDKDLIGEKHKKAMKSIIGGHFRALVAQLLQAENISVGDENGNENWLDIITYLSWEAAYLLKPDTSSGGGMDPGIYVKVKCLACGLPSESMLVKGVVCKKNVAHRRMTSKIEKPRILVLGGSLEYQRVSNALSSFDTLLQQEMDHLKMAVAKIASHRPNVLLVEKSVSRFAQEYLLGNNISLVLNIKRPLLERIARCTGAQIVPSIDHLSSPKLGLCDLFHVEKFLEDRVTADHGEKKILKTLMFFEGCPKRLGYTILLKGSSGDELKKIKHVVQYGVFAAYHLALETSFLADEGASLPDLPLKSPITVALPDKPLSINRSISTIPDFGMSTAHLQSNSSLQRCSMSYPNLCSESSDKSQGSALVAPENYDSQSSVLTCISDSTSNLKDVSFPNGDYTGPIMPLSSTGALMSQSVHSSCCIGELQNIIGPEENHTTYGVCDCQSVSHNSVTPASNLSSVDRRADDKHINRTDMTDIHQQHSLDSHFADQVDGQGEHEFSSSSSDHQSILVSSSSRCVWKGTVCERTHLLRIKYYGNFDKPLGRYLRDYLLNQNYQCQYCEMPCEAHVYCYTHRQGSLTISVRKLTDSRLFGEHDGKIWMWHRCLRCPRVNGLPPATKRVVMSDAAWGLSFGKFLELSFSNHAAASRVASCRHSLHRDCLRYYGCGRMVACFHYAPINVNSVYLPPPKLEFNNQNQQWVEEEVKEVTDDVELLYAEVLNSLCQLAEDMTNAVCADGTMKVELRKNVSQLELILQKEKPEFQEPLQKAFLDGKYGQSIIDVLDINKLRRKLLFLSYIWDRRLIFAAHSFSNTHAMANGLPMKNKENLRNLGINNTTLQGYLSNSKDSEVLNNNLLSKETEDGAGQYDHYNVNNQNGSVEDGIMHKTQGENYLSSSRSSDNEVEALESGLAFHRVLSEGQFKTLLDLSDTLDAKWTGERGLAEPDDDKLRPAGLPDATNLLSAFDGSEEQCGSDTTVAKSRQSAGIWIKLPFSDIYNSFNKNYYNLPRYEAWSEYVPKYVHSFKKLIDQAGRRLLLTLGVNDTVIPVYDDEPTSIVAYALVSLAYHLQMFEELEKSTDYSESSFKLAKQFSKNIPQHHSVDNLSLESFKSFGSLDDSISKSSLVLDPPLSTKAMHTRLSFPDDWKVKYTVTCYFAKCFDALRRICCPSELDFVRSISRCKKWGAQGGKSNVFFAKTLDDRFIIKQVTKTELESFIKFAPEYFKYLSESIETGSPTCLAKILGIYQVTVKHLSSGKETKMDLQIMENLLFGRKVTKLYDLKGSSRSRYNADSSGNNTVLLDQNLIDAMPTSPIFVGNKAKRLLERAVWNDTAFLASVDVMDYSLLVGVDENNHELVLGIIDFMRQYTWDKHLETWVKASGILGGPRNVSPTVISPKEYKVRFRKAMSAYFLVVPDDWSPSLVVPNNSL